MKNLHNTYKPQTRNRILCAAKRLARFGEFGEEPYSRSFDNCFEMGDGDEVVKGVIELAETDTFLARGIHYMGGNCLEEWIATAGADEDTANAIRERAGVQVEVSIEHTLKNSLHLGVA